MEERERLRREIRLLQGLIDNHRNTHGDVPRPLSSGPRQHLFSRRGTFSARYSQLQPPRDFQPRRAHSWRKKYSLVNQPPGLVCDVGIASTSGAFGSSEESQSAIPSAESPERQVDLTTDGNIVVGIQVTQKTGIVGTEGFSDAGAYCDVSGLKTELVALDSSIPLYANQEEEEEEAKPSLSVSFSSSHRVVSSSYQFDHPRKVHLAESSRSASESAVTLKTEPQPLSALPSCDQAQHSAWWKPEPPDPGQCSWDQVGDVHREPKLFGNAELQSKPAQAPTSAVVMSPLKNKFSIIPKVSSLQRAASVTVSSKASKFRKTNYTWVANPTKCSRPVKRWISPRASDSAKKIIGGTERGTKISPKTDLGTKMKKSGLQSKVGVSPSKYKWKASSLQTSPSTSKSAFKWQSEDQKRPSAFNLLPPSDTSVGTNPSLGEAVLTSYKVKSRTKIIKRKASSSNPSDKKSSPLLTTPLKSPFHPKKKNTLRGKASVTPKRSSPKGLVQITKHRLCRLPAAKNQGSNREGANLHFLRSPPASKVIKTRYRIVKKNVVTPSSPFSSSGPNWKMRRLLASRSPHASSTPKNSKSQAIQQRWKSKGYRCIGGVMYRVSANKLSKTSNTPGRCRDLSTKSPGRAARLSCTPSSPGFSPFGCLNRSATSRYIASRAVQRSLAIIRQAKQKKEKKKEYCMYYNRFGKCNRGENCPYIHDPEKVAVCTRFLRGTCKKTDGKCPFSHKVSKDKMPVCSYFLKGICNNSNCPYSHVYVSRKAEVCQDFLKGYCPMGEKCKKKHTLVCPDFAKKGICPRGACCKLLHPRKKRHSPGNCEDGDPPSKWRRLWEKTNRNDPAQLSDDGEAPGPSSTEEDVKLIKEEDTPRSSCLQKLPSFISLQSSTSPDDKKCKEEMDEDEPMDEPGGTKWKRTSMWATLQDSESTTQEEGSSRGKQLQIKPRL
ncbi:zinc finger CCCH domain-containing protein 3 [Excalfactoria chinensis]|uniref:zinc finger CCCH domain-containing protein 3 n=1 Tax=Excalfactoria chinensis TaxID=46218 RepID=UPI003B3BC982